MGPAPGRVIGALGPEGGHTFGRCLLGPRREPLTGRSLVNRGKALRTITTNFNSTTPLSFNEPAPLRSIFAHHPLPQLVWGLPTSTSATDARSYGLTFCFFYDQTRPSIRFSSRVIAQNGLEPRAEAQ